MRNEKIKPKEFSSQLETKVQGPLVKWEYDSSKDEMRGIVTQTASIISENGVNFQFPYQVNGGSKLQILLRKRNKKYDAIIRISKGQFLFGIYGFPISVKFDDEKIKKYDVSRSDSHDSDIAFINGHIDFIQRIKKSKKVIIEAPFYREGRIQFNFESSGIKETF